MERDTIFLDRKISELLKEEFFHKLIYKANFNRTFYKSWQTDSKFHREEKCRNIQKHFLNNSKNGLALPDNKTCNKRIASKTMWYCHGNKINRLTVSVQNQILRNLVYEKVAFQINRQREKDNIVIKHSWLSFRDKI